MMSLHLISHLLQRLNCLCNIHAWQWNCFINYLTRQNPMQKKSLKNIIVIRRKSANAPNPCLFLCEPSCWVRGQSLLSCKRCYCWLWLLLWLVHGDICCMDDNGRRQWRTDSSSWQYITANCAEKCTNNDSQNTGSDPLVGHKQSPLLQAKAKREVVFSHLVPCSVGLLFRCCAKIEPERRSVSLQSPSSDTSRWIPDKFRKCLLWLSMKWTTGSLPILTDQHHQPARAASARSPTFHV